MVSLLCGKGCGGGQFEMQVPQRLKPDSIRAVIAALKRCATRNPAPPGILGQPKSGGIRNLAPSKIWCAAPPETWCPGLPKIRRDTPSKSRSDTPSKNLRDVLPKIDGTLLRAERWGAAHTTSISADACARSSNRYACLMRDVVGEEICQQSEKSEPGNTVSGENPGAAAFPAPYAGGR